MRTVLRLPLAPRVFRELRLHGPVGDDEELPRLQAVTRRRQDQGLLQGRPGVGGYGSGWIKLLGRIAPTELFDHGFGCNRRHRLPLKKGGTTDFLRTATGKTQAAA